MVRDIHQARCGDRIRAPDGMEGALTGAHREKDGRYMLSIEFPDGRSREYEHLQCELTY